ncbi:MAG: ABC transporter substrate-binding protein [Pirellulaceae bacterium]
MRHSQYLRYPNSRRAGRPPREVLAWGAICVLSIGLLGTSTLISDRGLVVSASAQEGTDEGEMLDLSLSEMSIGEREPFDRIYLNAANDNAVLDTQPLELPGGRVPENPPAGEWLRFRLLDPERSEYLYEVPWAAIVNVERYPDMLLAEAKEFVEARDFDKAFPAMSRLLAQYPDTKGLDRMHREFLYVNARQLLDREQLDEAIIVLDELDRLDPTYRPSNADPPSSELLATALNEIVGQYVRDTEFDRADEYMTLIQAKYGDTQNAIIDRWKGEIEKVALGYMQQAQQALDAGDGRAAHQAVRRMFGILRDLDGGRELAAQVLERFPLVIVAVPNAASKPDPNALDGWSRRRMGTLFYRTLIEARGQGQDGGVYDVEHGQLKVSDDRRTITVEIQSDAQDPLRPPVGVYEFSRRLLDLADSDHPEVVPAWTRLLDQVEIESPQRVRIDLRFPHVLPESLVNVPLTSIDGGTAPPNLVYEPVAGDPSDLERRYLPRKEMLDAVERGWPEITEQIFNSHLDAVAAIERADIDVIEQVFPADVPRLRANADLLVERYQLPVIHVLIPNRRNVLMQYPAFRRALLYGTNREMILRQVILGGAPLEGADLVSGPFPIGVDESDPLNYGYDFRLEPIPYEKRLGQALVGLSKIQFADQLEAERVARGEAGPAEDAEELDIELVLAYPHGDVPRLACETMVKQLQSIGIKVTLRPLPIGETLPSDDDWDLLYSELVISEPLVDARRLLAEDGLAALDLPPVELALRRLDTSESWGRARRALYDLHMLTYNDVSILPLWQLPVYHARRKGLEGVGNNLRSLYDNVNSWNLVVETEE